MMIREVTLEMRRRKVWDWSLPWWGFRKWRRERISLFIFTSSLLSVKYVFNRNSKELTSVTCVVEVEDMLRHPSKVTKVGQSYDQVELLLFHQVCT